MNPHTLLTVKDVAIITGLGCTSIRYEADSGELPHVRIGRRRDRRFEIETVRIYCGRIGLSFDPSRLLLVRADESERPR